MKLKLIDLILLLIFLNQIQVSKSEKKIVDLNSYEDYASYDAYDDMVIGEPCQYAPTIFGIYKSMPDCLDDIYGDELPPEVEIDENMIMCCFNPKTLTSDVKYEVPSENFNRISALKCQEYEKLCHLNNNNPEKQKERVKRYTTIVSHGEPAKLKEFPHMAILFYNNLSGCGGSLISDQFVLTAAHCEKFNSIIVSSISLGIINLNETQRKFEQKFEIFKFIKHDEYISYQNDIALIQLNKKVIFNEYIRPLCLPLVSDYKFQRAIITGWGAPDKNSRKGSPDLLKGFVEEFDHDICLNKFASNTEIMNVNKTMHLCAGTNGKVSACQGDSGGPLQLDHDLYACMFIEVGVVSLGFHICGSPGFPSIYTRVYTYLDWIESIVWPELK